MDKENYKKMQIAGEKVFDLNYSIEAIKTKYNEMVLDKAGAYAIQDDNKFHIIKEIKGSYNNVIGFPIEYIKEDIDKLINS